MEGFPILTVITFLPLVGALFILLVRGSDLEVARNARFVAFWTSLITFLLSLVLWIGFDPATAQFQFEEKTPWLTDFGCMRDQRSRIRSSPTAGPV